MKKYILFVMCFFSVLFGDTIPVVVSEVIDIPGLVEMYCLKFGVMVSVLLGYVLVFFLIYKAVRYISFITGSRNPADDIHPVIYTDEELEQNRRNRLSVAKHERDLHRYYRENPDAN